MVKKNIICIVQARVGSRRFPEKILKKINSKLTVLEFLVSRLKKSKSISKIVVACPDNVKNDKIVQKLKNYKVNFFRGSELNVLDRHYKAAKKFKADVIIRITSDCPFSDPVLIDKLLKIYFKKKVDYLCNTLPRTFADGFDIDIFNMNSLRLAYENAVSKYDREHVTSYLLRSKRITKYNYKSNTNYSKLRITLDYEKDLKLMRDIVKEFYPNKNFSWKKITNKLIKMGKNAYN